MGAEHLLATVKELQPGILVNDRLGIPGDYVTPEQYQPDRPLERGGERVTWEACHTLNGSWGYDRDNHDYKDPALLVRMLVQSVACGGNLILNVGPNGRGALDPQARATLRAIGEWTELHGRSVHGAGPSALEPPSHTLYTQSGNRLYLHLPVWPLKHLHLPGLAGRVRYAQLLHDGSEIRFHETDGARHEHNNLAPPSQPHGDPDSDPADRPARRPAPGDRAGVGAGRAAVNPTGRPRPGRGAHVELRPGAAEMSAGIGRHDRPRGEIGTQRLRQHP